VEIGKHLAKSVDVVLLIDNLATRKMQEGLLEAGFNKNHIQIFSTPLQAHQALKTLLHKGDVIVFQNDIPDNY
jgi:UDP-N-acetylmuramoyl-tripeptide--D-alanyl-D-alanine ligase